MRLGLAHDDGGVNTPTLEQRRRFEQLCLLRSLYARRGPNDATGVLPLAELAAHARTLMAEPRGVESQPVGNERLG